MFTWRSCVKPKERKKTLISAVYHLVCCSLNQPCETVIKKLDDNQGDAQRAADDCLFLADSERRFICGVVWARRAALSAIHIHSFTLKRTFHFVLGYLYLFV